MENLREKVIQLLYEKSLESSSRESLTHDTDDDDHDHDELKGNGLTLEEISHNQIE